MDENLLEMLLDVSKQMAETRVLDPLLHYAMGVALKLVKAERGYLILKNDDRSLDFRVKLDREGNELESPEGQISHSMLNRVMENAEPLVVTDALVDPSFHSSASVNALQLRSVMCVPLISRGDTIGAIYVENRSNANIFENKDLPPLTIFASQAAVSIENAMLNDDLEARVAARTAELEEAKSQVEQSFMESVEANRIRTMFLSNVAHDIRSPLNMVVGALSLLEEGEFGPLTSDQQEWISKSLRAVDHIVKLTDDFFDLTKIEMGKLVLYPEVVDMTQFLQLLFEIGEGMRWNDDVDFELQLEPDLPSTLIDPTRIQQVILNLISNAEKFTSEGSVTLHAQHHIEENEILIGVKDTGPGIPPDEQEKIFDRFQQARDNKLSKRKGTGLGLSICRELVELHQGKIWVESELNNGSDFKFTLPVSTNMEASG